MLCEMAKGKMFKNVGFLFLSHPVLLTVFKRFSPILTIVNYMAKNVCFFFSVKHTGRKKMSPSIHNYYGGFSFFLSPPPLGM